MRPDEGPLGARRAAVDRLGEHLLADAGLAEQDDADVAGGDARDDLVQTAHPLVADDHARQGAALRSRASFSVSSDGQTTSRVEPRLMKSPTEIAVFCPGAS